ncbi:MAG: phosphatidylserine decarboxylase family protein [Acidobacteria bacterium]|nr:phosphatidylserine decarboxylase family protein [Acidobacteriota bacterium]
MSAAADRPDTKRRAGWLPEQEDLEAWLTGHRRRVAEREPVELSPVMQEFAALLDGDPVLRMYFERMIAEAPVGKQYEDRPFDSVDELLAMIDEVLTMAPEFGDEMAATPLGAVLDWTMGTTSGFAAYRDPRLNLMLRKVLSVWCDFLSSEESLYVLNDSETGWKSERARATIGMDDYRYDPDDEHWGFTSWNDFFTRRFRDGARPVADPDDDKVIVSACESTPYGVATDVERRDRFWIKSQPYSLEDMLAGDEAVDEFVGGTVYQAFLSANNYHRWHSPVSGTIVRAYLQEGTYYSEADTEGADATEPIDSQGYITHVAARAIFIIRADDPVIGLMAFVPVGMVEVSSCIIAPTATPGQHVTKGDELGHFQFGGSTHCLVFRPGAIAEFSLDAVPQPHDPNAPLKRVNTRLAVARGE